MKKSTKKTILITTSILALSASLFAAFGGNFNFENVLRAKSSNTIDSSFSFDTDHQAISYSEGYYTNKAYSSTYTGWPVYAKIENIKTNPVTATKTYMAFFDKNEGTVLKFYSDSNCNNEIVDFYNIQSISLGINNTNHRAFSASINFGTRTITSTQTESRVETFDFSEIEVNQVSITISSSTETAISSITVNYSCSTEGRTLTGISISKAPDKTSYTEGELFDPEGMVVMGSYSDGIDRVVGNYTYSPSAPLTTQDTFVTISYGGFSVNQAITVSKAQILNGVYSVADTDQVTLTLDFDNGTYNYKNSNQFTPRDITYNISFISVVEQQDGTVTFSMQLASGSRNSNMGGYNLFNSSEELTNTTGVLSSNKNSVSFTVYNSSIYNPGPYKTVTLTKQA